MDKLHEDDLKAVKAKKIHRDLTEASASGAGKSFCRKIPRDLTEASSLGDGMSILATLFMIFLFGMKLNSYLTTTTSTSVIVDNSRDEDHLRISFNVSFSALSCEFASVNVNDVLRTNSLNITKEIRKYSIDQDLKFLGSVYSTGPYLKVIRHDAEIDVEYTEGAVSLNAHNFDISSHLYSVLVVNFFAPWCSWSQRLVDVKKALKDEGVEAANKLVYGGKEHHPSWLIGRLVRNKESKSKSSSTSCDASSVPDHYVSDLTVNIRAQLQQEMDVKLDQKVREMIQKLSDQNPDLKLKLDDSKQSSEMSPHYAIDLPTQPPKNVATSPKNVGVGLLQHFSGVAFFPVVLGGLRQHPLQPFFVLQ